MGRLTRHGNQMVPNTSKVSVGSINMCPAGHHFEPNWSVQALSKHCPRCVQAPHFSVQARLETCLKRWKSCPSIACGYPYYNIREGEERHTRAEGKILWNRAHALRAQALPRKCTPEVCSRILPHRLFSRIVPHGVQSTKVGAGAQ